MAIVYPVNIDTFTNPGATDTMSAVPHHSQHGDANDAIHALEIKVGIDNSANPNSLDYRVGQLEVSFRTVDEDDSVGSTDRILLCDATVAGFTVTLPVAANSTNRVLLFIKTDSSDNYVGIKGAGSELISGQNLRYLPSEFTGVRIGCDGAAWYILP